MERKRKPTWPERRELAPYWEYINGLASSPDEYLLKQAIRHFLHGEDAEAELNKIVEPFIAKRACERARVWLGNERAKRRMREKEILDERRITDRGEFTYENFRGTIDHPQNRIYGMVNVSIYCIVEIWTKDSEDEVEKEYLVNFSDYKTKEWLTRLMVWALMNEREILIKPASEKEMSSMRMFVPKGEKVA